MPKCDSERELLMVREWLAAIDAGDRQRVITFFREQLEREQFESNATLYLQAAERLKARREKQKAKV